MKYSKKNTRRIALRVLSITKGLPSKEQVVADNGDKWEHPCTVAELRRLAEVAYKSAIEEVPTKKGRR